MRMFPCKETLQLLYHILRQNMFDLVGIPVYVTGRDIGMGNKKNLPQPVIPNHIPGNGVTPPGQRERTIRPFSNRSLTDRSIQQPL